MEFERYLMNEVRKALLKKGRVIKALTYQCSGYIFEDESIDVYFRGKDKPMQVMINTLPYNVDTLIEYHEIGYVLDKPSSQREVKKDIYICTISNGNEEMIIESRNPHLYENMLKPIEAIGYIPDRNISFNGKSIQLNTGFHSIGHYDEKRTFKNIVEYSQFEDTVRVEKITRK